MPEPDLPEDEPGSEQEPEAEVRPPPARPRRERKSMLLRLDPDLHDALARWASDDLRSTNAHVEWLLRRALKQAGRLGDGSAR
jgi:hypothetical protein